MPRQPVKRVLKLNRRGGHYLPREALLLGVEHLGHSFLRSNVRVLPRRMRSVAS